MTLTLSGSPLATDPPQSVNYELNGPPHKLLLTDFPRRVRATFAGETVLDTVRGKLLHESNLLPVLYVHHEDVRNDLLAASDHTTHCPFKGDARYWSLTVGERSADNAAWGYPDPHEDVPWLGPYLAFFWDRLDAWFDEDEQVHGHLRDPYHRVDARRSSRHVVVTVRDRVVAESSRPVILSETGLPNRYYLPAADIRTDLLESSTTRTHCPYKGWASYWNLVIGDEVLPDAAWGYHEPFDDAALTIGHRSLSGDEVTTTVDGHQIG